MCEKDEKENEFPPPSYEKKSFCSNNKKLTWLRRLVPRRPGHPQRQLRQVPLLHGPPSHKVRDVALEAGHGLERERLRRRRGGGGGEKGAFRRGGRGRGRGRSCRSRALPSPSSSSPSSFVFLGGFRASRPCPSGGSVFRRRRRAAAAAAQRRRRRTPLAAVGGAAGGPPPPPPPPRPAAPPQPSLPATATMSPDTTNPLPGRRKRPASSPSRPSRGAAAAAAAALDPDARPEAGALRPGQRRFAAPDEAMAALAPIPRALAARQGGVPDDPGTFFATRRR